MVSRMVTQFSPLLTLKCLDTVIFPDFSSRAAIFNIQYSIQYFYLSTEISHYLLDRLVQNAAHTLIAPEDTSFDFSLMTKYMYATCKTNDIPI